MLKPALTAILIASPLAAWAEGGGPINFMSWGGAFSAAQDSAFVRGFRDKTGIGVTLIDSDNPAIPIKAQVEAGNVSIDVATVDQADAIRLCDEGLLAPIEGDMLAPGADGTPADLDYLPGAISPCFAPSDIYSTVVAFDASRYPDRQPSKLADFFDLKTFPGRRGLHASAKATLEMALLADGVPPADVYATLATPEGEARAFAKLDTIKDQVVWWDAGAQAPQLLADGEVAMTASYSGRIVDAMVTMNKPFRIIWDGQVYEVEGFVIPKGAPHEAEARQFVTFATTPESLAAFGAAIGYGPARRSAWPLVTAQPRGEAVAPNLPTAAGNMTTALASSNAFWADHDTQLAERFSAWLAN